MTYFKYKNKAIYFEEIGNHKQTVILLPGNTASSVMFFELVPDLTEQFKVVLIDFLGTGQSERVSKVDNGTIHIFEKGSHPALLSNRKEFAKIAVEFIKDNKE